MQGLCVFVSFWIQGMKGESEREKGREGEGGENNWNGGKKGDKYI